VICSHQDLHTDQTLNYLMTFSDKIWQYHLEFIHNPDNVISLYKYK